MFLAFSGVKALHKIIGSHGVTNLGELHLHLALGFEFVIVESASRFKDCEIMLKLHRVIDQSFDLIVETDHYVPLSVYAYEGPMGANFYRIGNFATSLIEITVDPETGGLRGFSVVSFDQIFEGQISARNTVVGLPAFDLSDFHESPIRDELRPFSLGLRGNIVIVATDDFEKFDTTVSCGRLKYYFRSKILVGMSIENLEKRHVEVISSHLSRIKL